MWQKKDNQKRVDGFVWMIRAYMKDYNNVAS